jgi:hypothetical protein
MFSRKAKRKSSLRNVSADGGLSASLLAGDALQMAPTHHQPKSFFNNDEEEETKSESTATVAEEETFESVGYGWDLVIIIPIPQQEEIGKLERSHEHDEVSIAHFFLLLSSESPRRSSWLSTGVDSKLIFSIPRSPINESAKSGLLCLASEPRLSCTVALSPIIPPSLTFWRVHHAVRS